MALKDLEARTRSPLLSLLEESLDGITTLRCFKAHRTMQDIFGHSLNINTQINFLQFACVSWLILYATMVASAVTLLGAYLVVMNKETTEPAVNLVVLAGLPSLAGTCAGFIITFTEAEKMFNAAMRMRAYRHLEAEAHPTVEKPSIDGYPGGHEWEEPDGHRDLFERFAWEGPQEIVYSEAVFRYRPSLVPNMNHLSVTIQPGEKVGVCGRTGAGKSTMFCALFRLNELDRTFWERTVCRDIEANQGNTAATAALASLCPEVPLDSAEAAGGKIYLGGKDLSEFPLHEVRRSLCIIPQEPLVFSGSIRRNIDPLDLYTTEECWQALRQAHLATKVNQMADTIDSEADSFSTGQKQLLCLARAILCKPKILICDEVTANVDIETDSLIQQTLRTVFRHCTIMTIAHRLDTIIDSDKILSMNSGVKMGTIGEFGPPWQLLGIENNVEKEEAISRALATRATPEQIFKGLVDGDKEKRKELYCMAFDARNAASPEERQKLMETYLNEVKERQHQERQNAVRPEVRGALEVLIRELYAVDSAFLNSHDEHDKLKVEELWSGLQSLQVAMLDSNYARSLHSDDSAPGNMQLALTDADTSPSSFLAKHAPGLPQSLTHGNLAGIYQAQPARIRPERADGPNRGNLHQRRPRVTRAEHPRANYKSTFV